MSNINTMSQTTTGYESYNLSIALYETSMRKETDEKTTYHARLVIRKTVDMESVANDMITTSAITGYTVEQILEVWNVVNSAILDRVLNGAIVQSGIGSFYPRVIGSFTGKTDSYDPERHSIDIGLNTSIKLAFIVPVLEVGNYRITLTIECVRGAWVCKELRSFTVENDFIVRA